MIEFVQGNHLEDIRTGLESLVAELDRLRIRSIAIPALGCGLGGLNWLDVRVEIGNRLAACKTSKIMVFEPRESFQRN